MHRQKSRSRQIRRTSTQDDPLHLRFPLDVGEQIASIMGIGTQVGGSCVRSTIVTIVAWPTRRHARANAVFSPPTRRRVAVTLAGTVERRRTLRNARQGIVESAPTFAALRSSQQTEGGNPKLSETVCRIALACLTVGHMSVFPAARNGRPPAYQPPSPRLGVAHVP